MSATDLEPPAAASRSLVHRVLGERAANVHVEVDHDLTGSRAEGDSFEVEASGGELLLRGTSGVAVAAALRHYLAYGCGRHVTWDDHDTLSLPDPLPRLGRTQVSSPWTYRYHLNFCTFGYSAAYWGWERWEREIDWMALHGVNLPLCLVGHEAIWLRVLQRFGVEDAEARAYLGSPAFLPWTWMGCVHDHGAPMTDAWIEAHRSLAHRTLHRQRSLGMRPVLPGFGGQVPATVAGSHGADVDWMGFTNRTLDPRDPLFQEVGLALLDEQEREFGSDHLYAIDPFIEGSPPDGRPEALADVAQAIAGTLDAHDPRNTWVLQGWPFGYRADFWTPERIEAFLGAMPRERTLVLDLWAEHHPVWEATAAFAGRPWLWCMLHSLGGRPGMDGAMDTVAFEPGRIAAVSPGGDLRGVGTTMESLDRDPVMYEMFADVAWHGRISSIGDWLDDYVRRRYGHLDDQLREAWQVLATALYLRSDRSGPARSIVLCRPRLDDLEPHQPLNLAGPFERPDPRLVGAWSLLVDDAIAHGASPGLERDIVDIGQEVLVRLAKAKYDAVVAAYHQADASGMTRAGDAFLACLAQIDHLAATRTDNLLGRWVDDARSWGRTDEQRQALEQDARRLLTCWVEPGHTLQDYAGRHWSGLVSDYYMPRWRSWLDALQHAVEGGALDAADFESELRSFEEGWLCNPPPCRSTPVSDVVAVADAARKEYERLAAGDNSGGSRGPRAEAR